MNNHITLAAALALAIALTSCAYIHCPCSPGLSVEEEYLPKLGANVIGVKRIAVMPFEMDNSSDSAYASYATSQATKIFRNNPNFTLVDAAEVKRLQASEQSIENYVDAIFLGRITKIHVGKNSTKLYVGNSYASNSVYSQDKKTKWAHDASNKATHDTYSTSVTVTVGYTYSLMLTKDESLMGPISGSGSSSRSSSYATTNQYEYPDTYGLHESAINYALANIPEDFKFYKGRKHLGSIDLFDEAASATVNEELEKAFYYVGTGKFRYFLLSSVKNPSKKDCQRALEAYLGIYKRHKNIVAARNASILYEYLEGTESALRFIQKVYDDTGSSKAKEVIDELNKSLEARANVATHKNEAEAE